ncbi:Pycsar system effector family protein [Micromonospora sp. KC721]|uniref:Pycsar system effector family protein n=1 Tax=Micromonospora sp. KC721 TaxID=2530380 RepID=UPI0026A3B293|nr:Pycsar system effector family protein [Micromonospora sp. KC721]
MPDPGDPTYLGAAYASTYEPRGPHGPRRHFQIPTAGAHAVLVDISTSLANSTSRCTGCGTTDSDFSELEIFARAGAHASTCGRGTATAALDAEITAVRAELYRIDPKAGGYLQMAGVLLGAGLAVLGGAAAGDYLSTPALAAGVVTAVVVLAAVVLLLLASRPRLAGGYGFMAYADAPDAPTVLARLAGGDAEHVAQVTPLARARELWWLSRAVRGKYTAISRAVPLLLAGYAGAAVTAALAIWGR